MPTRTLLNQFTKNDFFAVFPAGFYVFIVVYACYYLFTSVDKSTITLWNILENIANKIQTKPVLIIFILFASYIFGSLFRALPVRWAERLIPPFKSFFPYPDVLKKTLEEVKKNKKAAKFDIRKTPDLSNGVPMDIYNYWKDVLCINSNEGFDYFNTFETRVRFFAGMLWSSLGGLLGCIFIIISTKQLFQPLGVFIFSVSLIVLITFGANFRRVRRQEARALLLIFLAF